MPPRFVEFKSKIVQNAFGVRAAVVCSVVSHFVFSKSLYSLSFSNLNSGLLRRHRVLLSYFH